LPTEIGNRFIFLLQLCHLQFVNFVPVHALAPSAQKASQHLHGDIINNRACVG
jgi:hypothetical protein